MTTQFKFGDIVRHTKTGELFVVMDFEEDGNNIVAVKKTDAQAYSVPKDELEIIPHPDTARLDWLEKQMLEDNPKQIVFDGFAFTTMEDQKQCKSGDHTTLRDAIDDKIEESK